MKFGESLRKERELRQITLEEISQRTRVHPRFLEAIENDDFSVLPAKAFAKGFLRSYARMVDLDEELVIANFEYCQHTMPRNGAVKGRMPAPEKKKTSHRLVIIALFLIIALLLALIVLVSQGHVQINWL